MDEKDGRTYLLAQATAAEADRLEERLMEDDELCESLRGIEDDLFDAYVRGHLSPSERAAFEARFGHQTVRIAFARALVERVPRQRNVSAPRAWLAAAAGVVLVTGAIWLARGRRVVAPPAPARPPVATAPLRLPTVVALVTLSTSRAATEAPVIQLPRGESEIELRVRLNPADRYERYSVELRSATANRVVWQASDLRPTINAGDLLVPAIIPSHALESGVYELAVRAGASDLGFVNLTVKRMP